MRSTRAGAMAVLVLLAGASCTPPPGPMPTPTTTASPPETELNRQRRLDFEAAEKAYRTLRAEIDRVLIAGGAKEATATMKATAAGPYLEGSTDLIRSYRQTKSRQVGKEVIKYFHQDAYSEAALLVNVCSDGTRVETFLGKKSLGFNKFYRTRVEVKKVEGSWRAWSEEGQEVSSCAE